jgi:hypothetical protein
VFKASAWLVAGAVLATAGVAHAQQRPAAPPAPTASNPVTEQQAIQSAVPWYLRFTTSAGVTESIAADHDTDRLISPSWSLNQHWGDQHWGVTVDVREAQRTERLDTSHGDQASVGAYYQFTPSLRLGGAVNVETPRQNSLIGTVDEPRADVRVESAFRF